MAHSVLLAVVLLPVLAPGTSDFSTSCGVVEARTATAGCLQCTLCLSDNPWRLVTIPDLSRGKRIRATLEAIVVVAVIVMTGVGISGYFVFTKAKAEDLEHVDAIVVLGGEHDGREDYGMSLARAGWANTVVISNPYPPDDPVMKRVCSTTSEDFTLICLRPDPQTTRGEAELMRRLAAERSWTKVIVISWRYHLPRARLIFQQCFSDKPGSVVMVAVPRRYKYSPLDWELAYIYQWAGFAKAVAQGECAGSA